MKIDAGRLLPLVVALLLPVPAAAQSEGWDQDFDQEQKPWVELQAQIPPYPKPQNLIKFEAGAASPHRFYIDSNSISMAGDGTVRYTLVIRTAGGATNVSFEGMRCETREQKYYATGRSDGAWTRARKPQWRHIEYQEVNQYHWVLYKDFFCNGKAPLKSPKEALDRLKAGS
jgi:hypothetical protein